MTKHTCFHNQKPNKSLVKQVILEASSVCVCGGCFHANVRHRRRNLIVWGEASDTGNSHSTLMFQSWVFVSSQIPSSTKSKVSVRRIQINTFLPPRCEFCHLPRSLFVCEFPLPAMNTWDIRLGEWATFLSNIYRIETWRETPVVFVASQCCEM